MQRNPDVVIHADWSVNSKKRWYCRADYSNGSYLMTGPFQLKNVDEFLDTVKHTAVAPKTVLLGFDFVIGVPYEYARNASINDFKSWLKLLGKDNWADTFKIASHPSEISIYRPFYPHNPNSGGVERQHLINGLNLANPTQLFRQCELKNDNRNSACALFWTLGANQVGRGSLYGWQNVIRPMLDGESTRLWPFDGELPDLIDQGGIVIAETYPAEYYRCIGIAFEGGQSKKRQLDRMEKAQKILQWSYQSGLRFDSSLQNDIENGFGFDNNGDDKFDSLIGLLGMLGVIKEVIHNKIALDKDVLNIEGWMLGT